ncbi:MAG: bifunctional (p)ppGpp synthetase/guanosine-3',5'-bis(diphosphate) 3'-pyrophosphohydrolase [Verrucomicrobia bacterium]|nr:bifunctional (p)ppGpp synthetase/guanosine-3',5'-bis(diphosphate) 3'-pyrophosphohydrolase [Verrucomicrobiota bacterium]
MGKLLSAIAFSAERHRSQRRKDAEASPYINHPIQVAEMIWNVGRVRDLNILIAAILHDTLEDTATSREDISRLFGAEAASCVCEVTDDKTLPKQERKRLQSEHAPTLSPGAKVIKLADKLCNVTDLANNPPADWPLKRRKEYLEWSRKVVDGLRGANPELERRFDETLKIARQQMLKDTLTAS